jgi:hypothetical protein
MPAKTTSRSAREETRHRFGPVTHSIGEVVIHYPALLVTAYASVATPSKGANIFAILNFVGHSCYAMALPDTRPSRGPCLQYRRSAARAAESYVRIGGAFTLLVLNKTPHRCHAQTTISERPELPGASHRIAPS